MAHKRTGSMLTIFSNKSIQSSTLARTRYTLLSTVIQIRSALTFTYIYQHTTTAFDRHIQLPTIQVFIFPSNVIVFFVSFPLRLSALGHPRQRPTWKLGALHVRDLQTCSLCLLLYIVCLFPPL